MVPARPLRQTGGAVTVVEILGDSRITVDLTATPDERMDQISLAQRGNMERGQLRQAGVSLGLIDQRIRSGGLIRVHPRVYTKAPRVETPLADETAALLCCGADAMLSDFSASVLLGLRKGDPRPIHVVYPDRRHGPIPDGVVVHRSRTLHPDDRRIHQGLPVTSAARTLLETAPKLDRSELDRQFRDAIRRRITTIAEIDAVVRRSGRHAGRTALERLIDAYNGSGPEESNGEIKLAELLSTTSLRRPLINTVQFGFQMDFYWPDVKLNVEADSRRHHSSPAEIERDNRRDAALVAKGIRVIRFTWHQITYHGTDVLIQVAQALCAPR